MRAIGSASPATSPRGRRQRSPGLACGLICWDLPRPWGVEKPDLRFFERIATELDLPPAEIAYVGDRVDNDIRPAAAAGMRAIFIRRGPWAWIQAPRDDPPEAAATIASLAELPDAFGRALAGTDR